MTKRNVRINVATPPEWLSIIQKAATAKGTTRSHFMANAAFEAAKVVIAVNAKEIIALKRAVV